MIGKSFIYKLFLGLALCGFSLGFANAQQIIDGKRYYNRAKGETPSHLPVPRFVSLKYNKINGRAGPDEDYPVKFIYHRQGLPVKVIAETDEWRKIQDPEGTTVWVHKRMLDAKRTLIIRQNGINVVVLRDKPRDDSKAIANLSNGVIGEIIEQTPGWCRVKIGGYKGWVRATEVYGA
jgi:SH3-like domain-containing protein